jgi:NAD(P)-dependent dehydrogenase (short-subunit alcohol dehydrogenase family)
MRFEGQVGLVTGAASGIGQATAGLLASEGAFVAVLDVDESGAKQTVDAISAAGGTAQFIRCDVSRSGDIDSAIREILTTHGRLDFAHNNAGISADGLTIDALSEESWDKVMRINARGIWLSMKYELAVMRNQRSGTVVNTSSVCAFQVAQQTSPYNAAKHAVVGMTKEAAVEFARLGVRVNAVCPGYTATPMALNATTPETWAQMADSVPLGRCAAPSEIAEAVAWLLSKASSYVTGHALVVDGGLLQEMHGPASLVSSRGVARAVTPDPAQPRAIRWI